MSDRITLGPDRAAALLNTYGSPLYVYDESIIRRRCREVRALCPYSRFVPEYSAKANSNIELLKIIRSEGFHADAMSPGEILLEEAAGFTPDELLFVSNNVSLEEMRFAADRGIMVSVDSLCQLEQYGRAGLPRRVAFRLNPGIGAGHSAKVVTGGKSKFGIPAGDMESVKAAARRWGLTIAGVNQHIGSLFLEGRDYVAAAAVLFDTVQHHYIEEIEFVDLGGGFGVPYRDGEARLDMGEVGRALSRMAASFTRGKDIAIMVEPGRYIAAESGVLIGTVHSVKQAYGENYVGTDVGFNALMRPVLYDSWHDIEFFPRGPLEDRPVLPLTITGNICESGDLLASGRMLPLPRPGDIIAVANAGAYGYSMASTYNSRLRPAEVLIDPAGSDRLIRRRDTPEDLLHQL
jgi:diaminopimelate decarboxylase